MAEELKEEIKEEVTKEETEDQTADVADTAEPVGDAEPEQGAEEPEYQTVEVALADGTVITAKVNGDNLISEEDVIDKLTPANLANVKFDGAVAGIMKLAGYRQYADGYHFVLLEKKQAELELEKMNAKIEYLAIMTDVEVE